MRIGKIAGSAEYLMKEKLQNYQYLEIIFGQYLAFRIKKILGSC